MTTKIIIAAITKNGVIGRTRKPCECGGVLRSPPDCGCDGSGFVPANDMPWGREYFEDLRRFQMLTTGHPCVMGSKTAESMGKFFPLKGRDNLIVSRSTRGRMEPVSASVAKYDSVATALEACENDGAKKAFVIGGAEIYALALPLVDELELTLIGRDWDGDVLFPAMTLPSRDIMGINVPDVGIFDFGCVSREPGAHPDLTFTRWKRR